MIFHAAQVKLEAIEVTDGEREGEHWHEGRDRLVAESL